MTELEQYRQEIETITQEMMQLLEARLDVSKKIAAYKKTHQMAVFQPEREKQLIAKLTEKGRYRQEKKAFLIELLALSKAVQKEIVDG